MALILIKSCPLDRSESCLGLFVLHVTVKKLHYYKVCLLLTSRLHSAASALGLCTLHTLELDAHQLARWYQISVSFLSKVMQCHAGLNVYDYEQCFGSLSCWNKLLFQL